MPNLINHEALLKIKSEPSNSRTFEPSVPRPSITGVLGGNSKYDGNLILSENTVDHIIDQHRWNAQSRWAKSGNAAMQAGGTILGMGISGIGALAELPYAVTRKLMGLETDMQNMTTRFGDSIKHGSIEQFPIYSENDRPFNWSSFSWWAKNAPNVASSLGILIPAFGSLKALQAVGRAGQLNKLGAMSKILKPLAMEGRLAETVYLGSASRIIENFAEGGQVYNNMKENVLTTLSDPEKFNKFINTDEGKELYQKALQNIPHGNDAKEKIAEYVASESAWKSFYVNSANFASDLMQAYMFTKAISKSPRASLGSNKVVGETAGMFSGETAKVAAKRVLGKQTYIENAMMPYGKFALAMASEGIEEVVNAIGTGEGMHYGKLLLGQVRDNTFNERLGDYLADPTTWEQGFWGSIGGGIFEGAGNARSTWNKIQGKPSTAEENYQLEDVANRKVSMIALAGRLKQLNRDLTAENKPYVGTPEEIAEAQEADYHELLIDMGVQMARSASAHGTADTMGLTLEDNSFHDLLAEAMGETEGTSPKVQDVIAKLKQVSEATSKFYDYAHRHVSKGTKHKHIVRHLADNFTRDKHSSQLHAEKANKYQETYNEKVSNDIGVQRIKETSPKSPEDHINNAAIEFALEEINKTIVSQLLQANNTDALTELASNTEWLSNDITKFADAFMKPVIEELNGKRKEIIPDLQLTKDEASTIDNDTVEALANAMVHESISKFLNNRASDIITNKKVIRETQVKFDKATTAAKDDTRTKFATHLSTIAAVTEDSTIDQINTAINDIKAEQVKISKGEVDHWGGHKNLLTRDVTKDLNTTAESIVKSLTALRESVRKATSENTDRIKANVKAVNELRTALTSVKDPTLLDYDETVTRGTTYTDDTYNQEVEDWVDDSLKNIISIPFWNDRNEQLNAWLTDVFEQETSKGLAKGIRKIAINKALEALGYRSKVEAASTKTHNAAVSTALQELQKAINDPLNQAARFASNIVDQDIMNFDAHKVTERQLQAAVKLFNEIAKAKNKKVYEDKATKLTFDEVLTYLFTQYGTEFMSDPYNYQMIQKAYLIISVNLNTKFKTTSRTDVLNKYSFDKALQRYSHLGDQVDDVIEVDNIIIQNSGGENAANIFLGNIQTSILRTEKGDMIAASKDIATVLNTLINDVKHGDSITISINTDYEGYEANKDNKKTVPIKVTITKSDKGAVTIGFVNPTMNLSSNGVSYLLDDTDYMDFIVNDEEVLTAIEKLVPELYNWVTYVQAHQHVENLDTTEQDSLLKALLDADTDNILSTLINLHNEQNQIEYGSPNEALLHIARVILFGESNTSIKNKSLSGAEIKATLMNWKAKLLRDKVNHNKIRDKIGTDINAIVESTITHKSPGNLVRSINPETGETIFRSLSEVIDNDIDLIDLFILEKGSGAHTLTNSNPNKKGDTISREGNPFTGTIYTVVKSANAGSPNAAGRLSVRLDSNTLDGSRLGRSTEHNSKMIDYTYTKLLEFVTLRRQINDLPDNADKANLHKKADQLEAELNNITPTFKLTNEAKDALMLGHGSFTFFANNKRYTFYFNRETNALKIGDDYSNNIEADLKEGIAKLKTNVVYSNFKKSFTNPVTGKVTSYKQYLLENDLLITDIGMLLDEKGNKISNVTISNDNNRGGTPLIINVDTSGLNKKTLDTKKAFDAFVKRNALSDKYNKFYKLIGELIKNKELKIVTDADLTDGFASYANNVLTFDKKWNTLPPAARSFLLMHEYLHKVLKQDGIDLRKNVELEAFRISIVNSKEFKVIDFDANTATIKMLKDKEATTSLTADEQVALNNALYQNKIYMIFANAFTDQDGNSHMGISAFDNEELITYGLTDTDVAYFLDSITSDKQFDNTISTKWQELKAIIKEFIHKVTGNTKLDELAAILDGLLEDVDSVLATPEISPISNENDTNAVNDTNAASNDDPNLDIDSLPADDFDIQLAVFTSNTNETTSSLSKRFKIVHPDGTMKRYIPEKQEEVSNRARKINATLTKENSQYRVKSITIAGEQGDYRNYIGLWVYPIGKALTNQYAKFISELDYTKPFTDLHQEYNDFLLTDKSPITNTFTPDLEIVPWKEGNSVMGFVNVKNLVDEQGNKVISAGSPIGYLGVATGKTFELQLFHNEVSEDTEFAKQLTGVSRMFHDKWDTYTLPKMFNTLSIAGYNKFIIPKFAFNDRDNAAFANFVMGLETRGVEVDFSDDKYTFTYNNVTSFQNAIFASDDFLDGISDKFTAQEEVASVSLVSFIYRKLKSSTYKQKAPESTATVRKNIASVIKANQQKNLTNFTPEQIALQNKIIEDLLTNNSEIWAMTLRELRGKFKHNPEDLDALLEGIDVENKWEDNSHLFDNPNNTLGDHLKDFLSKIPLVDPVKMHYNASTDAITYSDKINNSLTGFVESADYRILNLKLISLLAGIQSKEEMFTRLRQYGLDAYDIYGKTILNVYSEIRQPGAEGLANAVYSYYSKRLTPRYANLFKNHGEDVSHEMVVANKIHAKYTIADEWRNSILTKFDTEEFNTEWAEAWNKKYVAWANSYKATINRETLADGFAQGLSDLFEEIGITIDYPILQYYYKKFGRNEFGKNFLVPLNRLKSIQKEARFRGFIDNKILNPDIKFEEGGNLLRLAELTSYFAFGKGRFSSMNVKKNVVFTPANPHFISDFIDKLQHENDEVVMDFLNQFTNVPGSEYSYLLWGDQVDSQGNIVNDNTGQGFLNYRMSLGQRIPVSLNRDNINIFNYFEFDGINEQSVGVPKEYTDLSDSEWDLVNLIHFLNSERKTTNHQDVVSIPGIIPSDGGVIGHFNMRKLALDPTEDNVVWDILNSSYGTTVSEFKLDKATEELQDALARFTESPIVNALLNAYKAEIREIQAAARVVFEIDSITGLPNLDANNMPIPRKGIQHQLFYHFAKYDSNNQPIYFDETGKPTGRGFKSHLFKFNDVNGKPVDLNMSQSIFNNGFISQSLNPDDAAILPILLFRVTNYMRATMNKATTHFKEYDIYANKLVNKDNQPLLYGLSYNKVVTEMVLNHEIFNLEQQRFMLGTSANYKSDLDTTKRAKQIYASGVKSALQGSYVAGVINDLKLISAVIDGKIEEAAVAFQDLYTSKFNAANIKAAATNPKVLAKLNKYEKAIYDVIAPYFNNDSANAVSLITLDEFEKRLDGFGILDYYAELVNKLKTGATLTPDDYSKMVQLQKNFYYEYSYDSDLEKMIPIQVKNAEVILTPSLVKNLQLEDLSNYMNEVGIAQIDVESAEKVGTRGIARIHDDAGNLLPNFSDNLLPNLVTRNYEFLRKQQDVPDHIMDAFNKLGVQVAKKVFDNVNDSQIYTIFGTKNTKNGEQLIEDFFKQYNKNIKDSAKDLLIRLVENTKDIDSILDGTKTPVLSNSKLLALLREQSIDLNYSKDIIKAISNDILEQGNVPLFYNVFYKKWQAILTSLFTNKVINQKHPGPHASQMSTLFLRPKLGLASNNTQANLAPDTAIEWAKEVIKRGDYRLRTQRIENGNTLLAEVLMPRFNSKFFRKDGKYTIDELNAIDSKLLTMLGYRIPTEDKHSMIVFQVVGFLPDETAAIVLPDDFVTASGADFDIDSLYMMMYNIDRVNGEHLRIANLDESSNKILYNQYYNNVLKSEEAKVILQNADFDYNSLIDGVFNDDFIFSQKTGKQPREIQKLFVDKGILLTDVEFERLKLTERRELAENRKARENRMLDYMISIMMHPVHTVERNSPNGHPDLDSAKQVVNDMLGTNLEDISPSSYFGQREFRSRNISGRTLKAFSVSRDGLLSIFQRVGAYIDYNNNTYANTPLTISYIVDNKDDTRSTKHIKKLYPSATFITSINAEGNKVTTAYIPLHYLGKNGAGQFYNIDNKLITSYSAQLTANILDGVKDQLPKGVDNTTLGWIETFVNMGATYEEVIAFYNTPIMSQVITSLASKENALRYKNVKKDSTITAEIFSRLYKAARDKGMTPIQRSGSKGAYDIMGLILDKELVSPFASEIKTLLEFFNKDMGVLPTLSEITKNAKVTKKGTDQDVIDLQYLSVHKIVATITDEIRTITAPLGIDKTGAGPTFEKTKVIMNKLGTVDSNIKSKDQNILHAIFLNEDSSYSPFKAYYTYGNKLSYNLFKGLFITENPIYTDQINTLTNGITDNKTNPKRNEQAITFLNKHLLRNLPIFDIAESDLQRLVGHGKFRGKTFKFTQNNALQAFKKLSLSRKIELLRKRTKDQGLELNSNVLNYLVLEANATQFERNKYERISYKDNDIEDVIKASFLKMWISDDAFERDFARDFVRYAYHVHNLSYSYGSIARVISSPILAYGDQGLELDLNKGIGLSEKLYSIFEDLKEVDNAPNMQQAMTDIFGTTPLLDIFTLTNYKDNAFVYDVSAVTYHFENDQRERIFVPNEHDLIVVRKANLKRIKNNNIFNKYIKLPLGDSDWQVYKRSDIPGDDNYYYYPVNKLEPFDQSTTSIIPANNTALSEDQYFAMIEDIRENRKIGNVSVAKGINISSKAPTMLGKALSNPHFAMNLHTPYDIDPTIEVKGTSYDVNPVTKERWKTPLELLLPRNEYDWVYKKQKGDHLVSARTVWGNSVEAWYKANTNYNMTSEDRREVMATLIHMKLLTYPELFNAIQENGGVEFLKRSTHYVKTNRKDIWQGAGEDSGFIVALMDAYNRIADSDLNIQVTTPTNTMSKINNHSMYKRMMADQNLTGKDTTTLELVQQGLRTATTRSYTLGKVGDIITFEKDSTPYRITQVEKLTEENVNDPAWIQQWSEKEQWTPEYFKSVLGGKTVHVGSYQTTFTKANDISNQPNKQSGEQLDLFSQSAKFISSTPTNQDLIDAMTESGDLEIICSGGAKAENGMFIGSQTFGDWEVVTDLKGFPKHSAGGVDLTVGQGGSIDINNGESTFKAKDGVFIPNEPEIEVVKQPNPINQQLLKYL